MMQTIATLWPLAQRLVGSCVMPLLVRGLRFALPPLRQMRVLQALPLLLRLPSAGCSFA